MTKLEPKIRICFTYTLTPSRGERLGGGSIPPPMLDFKRVATGKPQMEESQAEYFRS